MNSKSQGKEAIAWIAAILVVLIWGETFVSSKILLAAGLVPVDIFTMRFILAYVFIWLISPKKLFCVSIRDELVMLLLGFTGGSLYFLSENTALRYSTASNVAILVCSAPLITALLMAFMKKGERMGGRQIAGSVVAFIGMVLVVLNGQIVLKLNPKGDLLALGGAVSWAIYSIFHKTVSDRYDPVFISRKVFGYGLLTIIPYYLIVAPPQVDPVVLARPVVWGNLLYLGLVAALVCFVLWNWALTRLGTLRTTNLVYCQPFSTMVISHLILGERITAMAVIGTLLIILGMTQAVKK